MKLPNTIMQIAMAGALLLPSSVVGSPDWDCIELALREELDLKLKFQDDFADLVSTERPEFGELAQLGAEATKSSFTMRLSRIDWLWRSDPSRFATPDDFWVLSWSEDDMSGWLSANPSNSALEERFGELRASLRGHPELNEFRTYVSDSRSVSPYLELYTAFGEDIRVIREQVALCF